LSDNDGLLTTNTETGDYDNREGLKSGDFGSRAVQTGDYDDREGATEESLANEGHKLDREYQDDSNSANSANGENEDFKDTAATTGDDAEWTLEIEEVKPETTRKRESVDKYLEEEDWFDSSNVEGSTEYAGSVAEGKAGRYEGSLGFNHADNSSEFEAEIKAE